MKWTFPTDLRTQVQRLWERGLLLSPLAGGENIFPKRLMLKGPDSKELSTQFSEVQNWIAALIQKSGPYQIKWRNVRHRVVGSNDIPSQIWIENLQDAANFIGKGKAIRDFSSLVKLTKKHQPDLLSWLKKRPLRALEIAGDWPLLLDIVSWINNHPRPAIYLRQMDLPGVHTKLIESYRGVLIELLDLVLPAQAIDSSAIGASVFCRRYGFLDKPLRVRFRLLDPKIKLLPQTNSQDITVTQTAFASLDLPISKVFITENEVNFLAFPDVADAMVIFGAGYGFENLTAVPWLKHKQIYYWGDIDTHGFAILNQLRQIFAHTISLLMNQQTLLAYQNLWGFEPRQETKRLRHLTENENIIYQQLGQNYWGKNIRLEQERIGFNFLLEVLKTL